MRRWLPALLVVAACGGQPTAEPAASPAPPPNPSPTRSTVSTSPSPTPTRATKAPTAAPTPAERADPRWHFFTDDKAKHTSPWFAGEHRVMIGYGCTSAPYYDHDARWPGQPGFHHGIDVAMACGTPLFSAVRGVVLDPATSGTPGAAYGENPFRIRTDTNDVLIGHTRQVFVRPGERVRPGQRIALSSDSGAPDGCHLHFEVRSHGGGVSDAVDPAPLLHLS
jgi:murein DD-endopeptidase MepM/ murein hydrolase activator NlpD